ncbi:MAG: DUF3667 domain-containing protein [Burkholderiaceae bacterium]|nr:MAG: DUF3667 domain-containing protein [Burkholderiaceae bacterium]
MSLPSAQTTSHNASPLAMITCSACQTSYSGNFCHHCGRAAHVERIDGHFILHELLHILHLEKGFFYTVWQIMRRPGATIRGFLDGDRNRLVKPLIFLILCSLVYTLVGYVWPIPTPPHLASGASGEMSVRHWVHTHYGYANFLMAILVAMCSRVVFFREKFNVFETWILIAYCMATAMLMITLSLPAQAFFPHLRFVVVASFYLPFVWMFYAMGDFYGRPLWINMLLSALAYGLGMLGFEGLVRGMGWVLDVLH